MKILLYTNDLNVIGGIETSFYHLAQYLKCGVRYTKANPEQIAKMKTAGIDIENERQFSRRGQEHCDILFVGSIWKRPRWITSRIIVQMAHADWSDDYWDGAESAIQMIKRANDQVDMFAAVSKSSATFVRKHTSLPVIVMNNIAPEPKKIKHIKNSKPVIAAFTRMTAEKGLDNYIALKNRLDELKIDVELRCYTDTKTPDGWEEMGTARDITTVLPEVDFVASLADTESFGYTIAEANACGVPCIIKRTNSTPEFFGEENIILDQMDDLIELKAGKPKLNLRAATLKSVDKAVKVAEELAANSCIIKCRRRFHDLAANKMRIPGETFKASKERADELIGKELAWIYQPDEN